MKDLVASAMDKRLCKHGGLSGDPLPPHKAKCGVFSYRLSAGRKEGKEGVETGSWGSLANCSDRASEFWVQ